jgi:hypothetical protein
MIFSSILVAVATASAGPEEVVLLSKEEAASISAQPSGGLIEVAAGLDDGPAIEMVSPPPGGEVQSPFPLHIRFSSQTGREVDLGKLKIELIKSLSFDITRRIKPYVSSGGIRIERVALPQGEFRFKVSLGDVAGGVSTRSFAFKVN